MKTRLNLSAQTITINSWKMATKKISLMRKVVKQTLRQPAIA